MKKYKEIFTPEARQRILDFTISSVEKFLENHPDEKFYGFAFSTHVYYGELTLAFNSEKGFQNTKERYLEKYNSHFTNRFSIGDWEYNLDGFLYTLEKEIEEESDRLYELHDGTLDIFLEEYLIGEYHWILQEFMKTETFAKIPKEEEFYMITIDHDESMEDAKRANRIIIVK